MTLTRSLAALLLIGAWAAGPGSELAAQAGPDRAGLDRVSTAELGSESSPISSLSVHHGFPLAGGRLALAVAGLVPGGPVQVRLVDALAAPPSLQAHPLLLVEVEEGQADRVAVGLADALGRLTLDVPLDHPDDPGRLIKLAFTDLTTGAEVSASLLVQPPMALVPTARGMVRVELLNGMALVPELPWPGPVLGAALSTDGLQVTTLLGGGRVHERSAHAWNGPLLSERVFDPRGDDLARAPGTGPLFVVVRPQGGVVPPPGSLLPLDGSRPALVVDPLASEVSGRRWAVTDDGLTAFLAEDDLIVREIDLLGWSARTPFTAGFNGDEAVVDLLLVRDRLLVASRRAGRLPGSLTVLDLRTGAVAPFALDVDPLKLVDLQDGRALVLAAGSADVQVVEHGVPGGVERWILPGERLLDGVSVVVDSLGTPGALLLLENGQGGRRLITWTSAHGLRPLIEQGVPEASRLASAGHDLALLLGSPEGRVYRLVPSRGGLEVVEGLVARPDAAHLLLP